VTRNTEGKNWLTPLSPGNWRLTVRVQPGARKNEVNGVMNGCLRIRLTAPAVENKANKALTAFVAGKLGLRSGGVTLAVGATSREKILLVCADKEPDWETLCALDSGPGMMPIPR
jgi:uncharacterized protein YggU (UPF0235/DUF167 family)